MAYIMLPGNSAFSSMRNTSNTKLLIHSNTTDGSTTFTDSSGQGHTLTAVDDVQHDTDQNMPGFGATAILFDGTDDEITTPIDSDFDFGTGDLTVEWWVRFAAVTADATFFFFQKDASDWFGSWWDQSAALMYVAAQNDGGTVMCRYSFSWTPSVDTWYHLAIVRNSTTLYVFRNGISQTLTEHNALSTNDIGVDDGGTTDKAYIGGSSLGDLNGWLDEFRMVKGEAMWTINFKPPIGAYT